MNNLPKITIITPTSNQGQFIEKTIKSVIDQGYPNLEYIIMDGGSTDNTIDILKKYDSQIIWKSEKDRGQSNALNKGLRIATGDIIAFINSDDIYEPGTFFRVAKFFMKHPQAHWVTGKCKIINQNGREIRKFVTAYKNFWLKIKNYNILLILDYISQPATFWSKELIRTIGTFNENLHLTMDYDYSLRVGKKYKLHVISECLANFRIHPASKSVNYVRELFNADRENAKNFSNSTILNMLHFLHNELIIFTYSILKIKNNK